MIVGSYGTKILEVTRNKILTFNELNISGSVNTSAGDSLGKKPTTNIKGIGLIKAGLSIQLTAAAGVDVWAEVQSWMTLKDAAKPFPLILCGSAVAPHPMLLVDLKLSDVIVSVAGGVSYYAAATLKLEFEEYIGPGTQSESKKNSKSAKGIASSGGSSGNSAMTAANPYQVPASAQKAAAKRTNPRM